MGKKERYFDECERLYVVQGKTLTDIKTETGVSLTSLIKWKDYGDWDKKRGESEQENADIKTVLTKIKKKLAKKLLDKLEEGDIDTQGLHVLNNLLRATSGKQYDDLPDADKQKPEKGGITQETAERLRKMVLSG